MHDTCLPTVWSQRGAALFVTLVILLLLTMIGVSAMRATSLEERMAGNVRDATIAFQAGEETLRAAEEQLAPLVHLPPERSSLCADAGGCGEVIYANGTLPDDLLRPAGTPDDWWAGPATMSYETEIAGVADQPRYVVEHEMFVKDNLHYGSYNEPEAGRDLYTVTARATGQTTDASAHLQSMYAKRFN